MVEDELSFSPNDGFGFILSMRVLLAVKLIVLLDLKMGFFHQRINSLVPLGRGSFEKTVERNIRHEM